jgi:hypothetical protein
LVYVLDSDRRTAERQIAQHAPTGPTSIGAPNATPSPRLRVNSDDAGASNLPNATAGESTDKVPSLSARMAAQSAAPAAARTKPVPMLEAPKDKSVADADSRTIVYDATEELADSGRLEKLLDARQITWRRDTDGTPIERDAEKNVAAAQPSVVLRAYLVDATREQMDEILRDLQANAPGLSRLKVDQIDGKVDKKLEPGQIRIILRRRAHGEQSEPKP